MFLGEFHQLRQTGHRAVVVHDFANHRRRLQTRHAGQIATSFGVASANQHAAFAGRNRENVAGLNDVVSRRVLGDGNLHGQRAVSGGNAGRHAFSRFDGNGESRAVLGLVVTCHLNQTELFATRFGQRQADQATAMLGHEIYGISGNVFGGHDQVTFVFTVFFIDQNDHAASLQFGNDFSGSSNGGMGRHAIL
jgi:hypothetical protein